MAESSDQLLELAQWADPVSTSLVLGAGASAPSGLATGAALARHLADAFEVESSSEDLAMISEIIEIKVGRRPLVDKLRAILDVEPRGGIGQIPLYGWRSIYTTNFDELIEKSAVSKQVAYTRVRSAYDIPELESLGKLKLFKIHGCLSQDRCYGDPSSLIATKSDYRKVRKWKGDLLRRMQVDLETSNVLIIGQSLSDPHLDELIQDVAERQEESGFKGKVRVLSYSDDTELRSVFEARGIRVACGDIDHFMSLVATIAREEGARPSPHEDEPHSVLPARIEAVTVDVQYAVRTATSVRKMFSGSPASYYDIAAGRTFDRDLRDTAVQRLIEAKVCVIKASAGLGKTTLARQVVLKRRELGALAWEHRVDLPLDIEAWVDVDARLRTIGRSGVLFLDNSTTYQRKLNELLRRLGDPSSRSLEIITTSEAHRWSRLAKSPELLKSEPLMPGKLTSPEMSRLLQVVRVNDDVRPLIPQSFLQKAEGDQRNFLRRACNSDIFVCLKNIFRSGSFDSIVLEEFNLLDEDIQDVYRLVAGLEAICGGSHRQLVMRMLGIGYAQIDLLLDRLEGLLVESAQSEANGVYIWRTRHSEIADIISRYKFADPAEHSALVNQLLENINVTVDIERNAIRGLCNQSFGLDHIQDRDERIELLEALITMLPDDHVLRHRIIREFLRAGEFGDAEQALNRAESEVGTDPPLARFRVELYRRRARLEAGLSDEDREALLRWAWDSAWDSAKFYSDNWHIYRSLIEVGIDWLDRTQSSDFLATAVAEAEKAYSRLFEPSLRDSLNDANRRLSRL